jgi:hypothetical protein
MHMVKNNFSQLRFKRILTAGAKADVQSQSEIQNFPARFLNRLLFETFGFGCLTLATAAATQRPGPPGDGGGRGSWTEPRRCPAAHFHRWPGGPAMAVRQRICTRVKRHGPHGRTVTDADCTRCMSLESRVSEDLRSVPSTTTR